MDVVGDAGSPATRRAPGSASVARRTARNITVGLGGEATCTITNDDIAPKLHLRKVVVNDNGGTATVADFTLTADGTGCERSVGHEPGRFGCRPEGRHVDAVGDRRRRLCGERLGLCRWDAERVDRHHRRPRR